MTLNPPDHRLQGLSVLERGWLSCNNVLLHGTPERPSAVLVDSAHLKFALGSWRRQRHAAARAGLHAAHSTGRQERRARRRS